MSNPLNHVLSGIIISQSARGGFRFRTVDEIAEKRHEIEAIDEPSSPSSDDRKEPSVDEKKVSVEYIDKV